MYHLKLLGRKHLRIKIYNTSKNNNIYNKQTKYIDKTKGKTKTSVMHGVIFC